MEDKPQQSQSNESKKQDKKIPEDIFASSANPNVRLTPVDAKSVSKTSPPHERVELADTKASSSPLPPRPSVHQKRKINKVMVLMIVAIVVAIIFAGGFIAFQFFAPFSNVGDNLVIADEIVETPAETTQEQTDAPPLTEGNIEILSEPVDTDKDGLTDEREKELGLDINNADTDGDGLSDRDEVDLYSTDPFNPDTDSDGFSDGSEVRNGYDPNGPGRLNDINKQTP